MTVNVQKIILFVLIKYVVPHLLISHVKYTVIAFCNGMNSLVSLTDSFINTLEDALEEPPHPLSYWQKFVFERCCSLYPTLMSSKWLIP